MPNSHCPFSTVRAARRVSPPSSMPRGDGSGHATRCTGRPWRPPPPSRWPTSSESRSTSGGTPTRTRGPSSRTRNTTATHEPGLSRTSAATRAASPGHHVEAALPTLPFGDQEFDLALCSHLLFAYADRVDHDFHLRGIHELVRVAAEVRVFPLIPFGFSTTPALAEINSRLARTGLVAEIHEVDYELQRGANTMMRIARR